MTRRFLLLLAVTAATLQFTAAAQVAPTADAFLYNPKADTMVWKYPYNKPTEIVPLKPTLALFGKGFPNGSLALTYRVEAGEKVLHQGTADVKIENGWFELGVELEEKYPQAAGVTWEVSAPGTVPIKGYAPLSWSRFHGRVKYRDGHWDSTYINLIPVNFGAPGGIYIPVADDGTYDALVPARVYVAVIVCGTRYSHSCLERWAWDFDLLRDRDEVFTIGRTELYGMRAFNIKGGGPNVLVLFRPFSLTRGLRFDTNQDGVLSESETRATFSVMKAARLPATSGPCPELKADQVKVRLDGKPLPILQFNQIPEAVSKDGRLALYLLQVSPDSPIARGVWHEVKLEVESQEELRGKRFVDFGEGSVGFFR